MECAENLQQDSEHSVHTQYKYTVLTAGSIQTYANKDRSSTIASGYVFAGNFVVKTVAVAEAEVVAWRW